jgi:ribosome biogenesis GTPase
LINKIDLYLQRAKRGGCRRPSVKLNADADVHLTSVKKRKGIKVLKDYLKRGQSVAFIGSSGVGKSAHGQSAARRGMAVDG